MERTTEGQRLEVSASCWVTKGTKQLGKTQYSRNVSLARTGERWTHVWTLSQGFASRLISHLINLAVCLALRLTDYWGAEVWLVKWSVAVHLTHARACDWALEP